MSAPQPPVVVDAAAPAKRVDSTGGVLVRWLGWGVVVGVAVPALFVVVVYVIPGAGLFVFWALPAAFVGATVGGTIGALAGWGAVVFRDARPTHDRPSGYGPAKPTRQPTPRSTRALLVAWVAALGVGWAGCIVGATAFAGARLDPAIVVGVTAAFAGVALVATGVPAIPRVRVAAITAIVIGPILALGGFVVTIGASTWLAANPPLTIAEEQPGPQGSVPESDSEAGSTGMLGRIPGPPPLYGDGFSAANLGPALDEIARYSLLVAPVEDDDVSPDTLFPAGLVRCPWATEDGMVQATTDIWFDAADEAVGIQQMRDDWVTNGYTLVVDDPDLVVVVGAPGLVGAQYSVELTWDHELRLRMQSVCVPG